MHLIVSHHGMWGVPMHMDFLLQTTINKTNMEGIHILNSDQNLELATYDGIDVCGDRHVQLIEQTVNELESSGKIVDKVSFIGYSLGGLINRFAIGKLYFRGFFKTRTPLNFFTVATPHLGVQKSNSTPLGLVWNSWVGFFTLRTGKQITFSDTDFKWHNESHLPLLIAMCDPKGPFYMALAEFKNRELFANTRNDFSARFTTSAIESTNHFAKHRAVVPDPEKYPYIVTLDQSQPKEPENWDRRSMSFFGLFVVLSPIVLPTIVALGVSRLWKLRNTRLRDAAALGGIPLSHEWIAASLNSQEKLESNKEHEDKEMETEMETETEAGSKSNSEDTKRTASASIYSDETKVLKTVGYDADGIELSESGKTERLTTFVKCEKPTELPNLKNQKETRLWMVNALNSLGWHKCFTSISGTNAHAAIIVRRPNDEAHKLSVHLVEFIVERLLADLNA